MSNYDSIQVSMMTAESNAILGLVLTDTYTEFLDLSFGPSLFSRKTIASCVDVVLLIFTYRQTTLLSNLDSSPNFLFQEDNSIHHIVRQTMDFLQEADLNLKTCRMCTLQHGSQTLPKLIHKLQLLGERYHKQTSSKLFFECIDIYRNLHSYEVNKHIKIL